MIIRLKNKDKLIANDFIFKCCIGRKGLNKHKIEGDNCTPKGTFKIGDVYYRSDRVKKPITNLKCIKIKKKMGWCDDPLNQKNYNKLVLINKGTKCEKLYRKDHKYDLIIPIKYNYLKPIKFKGSCIFIHLTNNLKPTAGCIALKKKDFLIMLRLINKNTKIKIS